MADFTILGLVLLPVLLFTALRFRWILSVFILSVPWKTAVLVTSIGHQFTLPEVALLILLLHICWRLLTEQVQLPIHPTGFALLAFASVATISVVSLLIQPPVELYGRPYNTATGYGAFTLVKISFSSNSLTQLALRWFFVGATVGLGIIFATYNRAASWVLRVTVFNALLVGIFGILYQLSILIGFGAFPEALQAVGFVRFPLSPSTLGPLPRMFSITGEPGSTAHFLLLALAITAVTALSDDDGVFEKSTAFVLSLVLLGLIVLTTGTTGYGGLIVFSFVLLVTAIFADSVSLESVLISLTSVLALGLVGIVGLTLGTNVEILDIVSTQVQKLLFSAQSGSLRAQYISHSLSLWVERPWFGTGVGTQNGTSFLASALAETGTLGGAALVGAIVLAYRSGVTNSSAVDDSSAVAIAVAAATIGSVGLVARSSAVSLFPWLWLTLSLSYVNLHRSLNASRRD